MVKTKKREYKTRPGVYDCEECGKHLETARALAGHMWFAHNIRYGERHNLRREIKELKNEPRVNPDVNEAIKRLIAVVEKLMTESEEVMTRDRELMTKVEELITRIQETPEEKKEILVGKGNPDHESKEPDDDDDGLLDFSDLFGGDDDDEKKIKKTDEPDDDKSWFL